MKQLSTSLLVKSLGALLLTTTATSAFAQAPPANTTPQDLQRASPPPRDGSNRVSTVGQGQITVCPFSNSDIPVTINRVEISGATVLTEAQILKAYSNLRGQATTLSAVCDIRERLIVSYRKAGYPLVRVELPVQTITSEGVLKFNAIETTLNEVKIVDNAESAPFKNVVDGLADRLRTSTQGVPLKWSNVERFALLMRDTPGVVARLELRPTAGQQAAAPEAADPSAPPKPQPLDFFVAVEKPDRFGGFIGLQRNSADVFGRYAGVVGGQMRGVMPWGGDELSGVLYSTQTGRQAVGMASYEWRHGSGLLLKGSLAYAETLPGRQFAPLDLRGESFSATLSASYPFILRSAFQWEGTLGMDYVDQDNFVFEDQSTSNDNIRVGFLKTNVLWRDIQDRRARVTGSVEYRHGLDVFAASQKGEPTLSRTDADPEAPLWRLRADGEFRLRRNWPGVALSADAQIADKVLVSFEQYQVGNLTFGRGYDPGTITGDRGYGGRAELLGGRYAPEKYPDFQVEPYLFYDAAHVEQLSKASINPDRDVASWGGGVRFRYSSSVSLDIGAAKALDVPGLNQKKPGPQFLMNFAYQF